MLHITNIPLVARCWSKVTVKFMGIKRIVSGFACVLGEVGISGQKIREHCYQDLKN